MSINLPTTGSLFSNSLFFPSSNLVNAFSPNAVSTSVTNTVDGGTGVGNQFYGLGSDFLDPQTILGNVSDFSGSVSPVTNPNSILNQLVNVNGFSVNDNPTDIDHMTVEQLGLLSSPTFGLNIQAGSNSNPFTWVDPSALDIQLGTLFTSASLQTNQNFIPTVTNATLYDVLNALSTPTFSNINPDISQVRIAGVPITGIFTTNPAANGVPAARAASTSTASATAGSAAASTNNASTTAFSGFG